jgi:BirA family biotin operon repressor/biotin-[acetyl-CoA-carboxylase] ligase
MSSSVITTPILARLGQLRAAEAGEPLYLSGAGFAAELGLSRAAVSKAVAGLRALGVEIESRARLGYRLALPASPLTAAGIRSVLSPATAARLRRGDCIWSTTSTNTVLLDADPPPPGCFDFLTAELQTAGRGRRGRRWLAPPGGSICLSWSWSFERLPPQAGALSLAIGVGVLRALRGLGCDGIQIKWPNDLLVGDAKLGGILIELRSEGTAPVRVVVGLGLNVAIGQQLREQVAAEGTAAVDLASLVPRVPARERLAAALLDAGVAALDVFERDGLAPVLDEFRAADALVGRPLRVSDAAGERTGLGCGIDADGRLLLRGEDRTETLLSGEVSVRPRPAATTP